jgi:hypothetical protein
MRRAIRKKPIYDHAADREEKNQQAPQDLVQDWTVGWQYFDYDRGNVSFALHVYIQRYSCPDNHDYDHGGCGRTEHDYIEDEDNEADHTSADAMLPLNAVVVALGREGSCCC